MLEGVIWSHKGWWFDLHAKIRSGDDNNGQAEDEGEFEAVVGEVLSSPLGLVRCRYRDAVVVVVVVR